LIEKVRLEKVFKKKIKFFIVIWINVYTFDYSIKRKQLKNKIMTNTTKFEAGNVYEMRFIGDSELKPQFICTKRTAKTVTFEKFCSNEKPMSRRIKTYNNVEYILDGSYSMAPSISADKIVL